MKRRVLLISIVVVAVAFGWLWFASSYTYHYGPSAQALDPLLGRLATVLETPETSSRYTVHVWRDELPSRLNPEIDSMKVLKASIVRASLEFRNPEHAWLITLDCAGTPNPERVRVRLSPVDEIYTASVAPRLPFSPFADTWNANVYSTRWWRVSMTDLSGQPDVDVPSEAFQLEVVSDWQPMFSVPSGFDYYFAHFVGDEGGSMAVGRYVQGE